jgi:hypothetical protein
MIVQHYHYYNVWGFAKRQFNSGVMLNVLIRKHPRSARHTGQSVISILKVMAKLANSSAMRSHKPLAEDSVEAAKYGCLPA